MLRFYQAGLIRFGSDYESFCKFMIFFKRKTKKEQSIDIRHKRLNKVSECYDLVKNEHTINVAYYALFFVIVAVISFWWQGSSGPVLLPNQIAKNKVVSSGTFEYESDIKTDELRAQRRQMVLPVYKVDQNVFASFSQKIDILKEKLKELSQISTEQERKEFVKKIQEFFENTHNLSLQEEDLETLANFSPDEHRNRIIDEGLFILQETTQKGIFDETDVNNHLTESFLLNVGKQDSKPVKIQSRGNALRALRMNLYVMDVEYEITNALIHILKFGLIQNLVYDKRKTEEKMRAFVEQTPTVTVKVSAGDVVVDIGQVVTNEIYEKFIAYKRFVDKNELCGFGFNAVVAKKIFFGLILFVSTVLAVRLLSSSKLRKSNRCLGITGLVLLINIALLRATNFFASSNLFSDQMLIMAILPYIAPIFLSSILLTILIDTSVGLLGSFFIVTINVLIQNCSVEHLIIDMFATCIAVYMCRKVRLREGIAKAGMMASLILSVSAFVHGTAIQQIPAAISVQQSLATLASGIFTIILALGLLPIFERLFRHTTDITLLELTDYNHPLLRKLQLVAPGTYHHSLMVATLAEKVASEVNANPLLCRCCSLYHDIGKIIKPEYFTENQNESENPHEKQNPSMSALILKSHVKEGVTIAKCYKLPNVIIDVIQQHHGTSIMQYFYQKALRYANKQDSTQEAINVDEMVFRYDGPKPLFKESAIISLADSVEAASRSLTKVTPQTVEELVNTIINDKVSENQLNECNITLNDIDKIKKSFQFTLLNMLHARISYSTKTTSAES